MGKQPGTERENAAVITGKPEALTRMPMPTSHAAQSGSVSDVFDGGYAEVNGQRLHYVTSGNAGAPMMLFIHGAPNFSYYWED
jgi:hypothetical protein